MGTRANDIASLIRTGTQLDSDAIGTNAITAEKLNVGQLGGRRNLIINGAMQVAQRGTSVTDGTGATSYGLDRFTFEATDGGTDPVNNPITTQVQHSNSQITDGNRNALKISTTTAAIGTAQVSQRIERETFRHTIGQTVTFSCLVKRISSAVTGGTLRMIASVNDNNPYVLRALSANYPSHTVTETLVTGVQNIPADYTRYTASFTMPAGANTTDILEIGLSFYLFDGSTNISEDLFSISEMQLELGETATPFEHRSYGEELALCQRYYYEFDLPSDYTPGGAGNGLYRAYAHPVTMRASPTGSIVTQCEYLSTASATNYTPTVTGSTSHASVNKFDGLTNATGVWAGRIGLDAEL